MLNIRIKNHWCCWRPSNRLHISCSCPLTVVWIILQDFIPCCWWWLTESTNNVNHVANVHSSQVPKKSRQGCWRWPLVGSKNMDLSWISLYVGTVYTSTSYNENLLTIVCVGAARVTSSTSVKTWKIILPTFLTVSWHYFVSVASTSDDIFIITELDSAGITEIKTQVTLITDRYWKRYVPCVVF